MPDDYKSYALVGGTPVKIEPKTISEPGTVFAAPGCAFNPVTVNITPAVLEEKTVTISKNGTVEITPSTGKNGMSKVTVTAQVPSYAETLTAPYAVNDGTYTFAATGEEDATEAAVCKIESGAVSASYGGGTFAVDTTGETPALTWTPSITAESVLCWYASAET